MSSALAMVLTAAMAVPGNGPEAVPAEMEQGLDLSGEWEGLSFLSDGALLWSRWNKGELHIYDRGIIHSMQFTADDEGGGNVLLRVQGMLCRGIWRHRGEKLIICYGLLYGERPTSFQVGNNQDLLILHRVKPRK